MVPVQNNSAVVTAVNMVRPTSSQDSVGQNEWQQVSRRKKRPIVTGIKKGSSLAAVVKVNYCRLFISRLSPDVSTDMLSVYIKELISSDCTVEKLKTRYSSYSSFLVTCERKFESLIFDPENWEDGIMLRHFVGKHRTINNSQQDG